MKLLQTRVVEPFPTAADAGFFRARIPGIAALDDGEMLAYYECRASDSDWSAIDIGLRRIAPDGAPGAREILVSGRGRLTLNNPVMIADGDTVHFLHCENYKRLFYRRGTHGGRRWSAPTELTQVLDRAGFFWSVAATGPGHGLRTDAGRLLVPLWFAANRQDAFAHRPSAVVSLFSDDGGESWATGDVFSPPGLINPSECCAAQLPDGRLLLNLRNENPDRCRRTAVSGNGGRTWTDLKAAPALPDPVCCAGLCRAGEKLLFTHCADRARRVNLTATLLDADGAAADALRISEAGGYSDVCLNPLTGTAFVFYEADRTLRLAEIAL